MFLPNGRCLKSVEVQGTHVRVEVAPSHDLAHRNTILHISYIHVYHIIIMKHTMYLYIYISMCLFYRIPSALATYGACLPELFGQPRPLTHGLVHVQRLPALQERALRQRDRLVQHGILLLRHLRPAPEHAFKACEGRDLQYKREGDQSRLKVMDVQHPNLSRVLSVYDMKHTGASPGWCRNGFHCLGLLSPTQLFKETF